MLAHLSDVFKIMFNGNYAEKDKKEIIIPGVDKYEFVEFLRVLENQSTIESWLS